MEERDIGMEISEIQLPCKVNGQAQAGRKQQESPDKVEDDKERVN